MTEPEEKDIMIRNIITVINNKNSIHKRLKNIF